MTSRILGSIIERTYYASKSKYNGNNHDEEWLPHRYYNDKVVSWENIVDDINDDIKFNIGDEIYISEDEKVKITDKKYRLDLNCNMYYTDKIISTKEIDKEKAEQDRELLMNEYLDNNKKLDTFFKINNINPMTIGYLYEDQLMKYINLDVETIKDKKLIIDGNVYSGMRDAYISPNGEYIQKEVKA